MGPIISLCIPTNGVIEWIFPVLDSIYVQGVEENLFEVVITDNGNNVDFKKKIKEYIKIHKNIVYAETDALPFLNEIESYKRASGQLIKFVNHRTLLLDGTLQRLIDFVKNNIEKKPIIYFSNGVLNLSKETHSYSSFDQFVRYLSYWSSWSTGMAIWKDDFNKLPTNISAFNELFPHTTVLFSERNREEYCIDNSPIFKELPQGKKPKGNYDLFYAFGVEYPWIIFTLFKDGSIKKNTYKSVLKDNLAFVYSLYWIYCKRKEYCSYDLGGLNNMFGIFYSKHDFRIMFFKKIINKIYSLGRRR